MLEPYFEADGQTIYLGDCRDILPHLPSSSVDIIITDPPYGLDYQSHWPVEKKPRIINDNQSSLNSLIDDIMPEFIRILKENSEVYWFSRGGGEKSIIATTWLKFEEFKPVIKVKNLLIWDKEYVGLGWDWRYQYETIFQLVKGKGIKNLDPCASNVIKARKIIPQADDHPTPKSVDIIYEILKRKQGDVVLDPFLGSGATLVACRMLHRRGIGIEIEKKYCDMASGKFLQRTLF